jgi:hypothetical protein
MPHDDFSTLDKRLWYSSSTKLGSFTIRSQSSRRNKIVAADQKDGISQIFEFVLKGL